LNIAVLLGLCLMASFDGGVHRVIAADRSQAAHTHVVNAGR
jgi:hypothetical protein